jgi:hypothetical protein
VEFGRGVRALCGRRWSLLLMGIQGTFPMLQPDEVATSIHTGKLRGQRLPRAVKWRLRCRWSDWGLGNK